jgi:hypothetical protein
MKNKYQAAPGLDRVGLIIAESPIISIDEQRVVRDLGTEVFRYDKKNGREDGFHL